MIQDITLAILVKDKSATLPLYLECIYNQSYPKDRIHLYIRSNNNNDNSISILLEWIRKHGHEYKSVYTDFSDAEIDVSHYKNHEWNEERFYVLGNIRQESINHAIKNNSHYFVVDCDNFIIPETLTTLVSTNLPIVGPYLQCPGKYYSNYHHLVDSNGYYQNSDQYYWIHNQKIKGLHQVDVVHCTYYINNNYLSNIKYLDDTNRHEYVIFSDNCRKLKIDQYLDNRQIYGYITFLDREQFDENKFRELLSHLKIR